MGGSSRGLSLSNLRSSNVLVTVVVLVVVLALFFIPELINVHDYLGGEDDHYSAEPEVYQAEEVIEDEAVVSSPLGNVLGMVSRDGHEEMDLEERISPPAQKQHMTWDDLKGRRVLRDLRRGLDQITRFGNSMDGSYSHTISALSVLADAVDELISSEQLKGVMSAREYYNYIEGLDTEVTRALHRDRAPRAMFIQWAGLSLGGIFDDGEARSFREQSIPPFDPHLRLISFQLSVRQRTDGLTDVSIQGLRAYVIGNEIVSATVTPGRAGRTVRRSVRRPDRLGRRIITAPFNMPADSLVTFTVEDQLGNVFEKSYDIYRRAKVFGVGQRGVVKVPFSGGYQSDRLDRFFAVSPGGIVQPGIARGSSSPSMADEQGEVHFQRF